MAKTVVGLFDDFSDAQQVVQDLTNAGFSRNDISLVANDARGEYANLGSRSVGDKMDKTTGEQAGSGAIAGSGVGAALGLLVGLGALAIPGIGPVLAAGPIAAAIGSTALGAGIGAAAGGLLGPLVDAGVPRPEAEIYSEGVRRGGTLVSVSASDEMADSAVDIMNRYNVVDVDERGASYRESGWTSHDTNAKPYTADEINTFRSGYTTTARTATTNTTARARVNAGDEQVLPVVEEQIQIGKREVQRGGARIHSVVTERPVEEQVTLREEHVNIERRPVDRPVTDADRLFKEQTFEVTETAEEAVVAKTTRVVEEVVIGKEASERTETIRDSVRRQDVEVDQIDTATTTTRSTMASTGAFESYDNDFRTYYTSNLGSSGYTYEQYTPVFRYGYGLSSDANYRGKDWNAIEGDARTRWEERNPGTWEQFKDGIRYAWDRATNKR
ncbi:MAG: YsnF/AvaK domain-containing protein [Chloroflexales bacterium]|nr:YsnF/AvaK domain-containing protein [Chloroflexales bacterium]